MKKGLVTLTSLLLLLVGGSVVALSYRATPAAGASRPICEVLGLEADCTINIYMPAAKAPPPRSL